MRGCCAIVPSHLLEAIASSTDNPEHVQNAARDTLEVHQRLIVTREGALSTAAAQNEAVSAIASSKDKSGTQLTGQPENQMAATPGGVSISLPSRKPMKRIIYDVHNATDDAALPGRQVRFEGQTPVADVDVNKAYDNIGYVLQFYENKFGWLSYDGQNAKVLSSVHFGRNYGNAYWDFGNSQMIFGDGNHFLYNFTSSVDVIGHEITHAVTGVISPLLLEGQAGALNEHLSDVFGTMVRQSVKNQTVDQADWLIGEDCLFPGTKGVALRSMKDPGTAYNDSRVGKDEQVAHTDQLKTITNDSGGIHIFSGIPNKAFYLVAVALGGYSWEGAGQIWWNTIKSGEVPKRSTFQEFAALTVKYAQTFSTDAVDHVKKAWYNVGVVCLE